MKTLRILFAAMLLAVTLVYTLTAVDGAQAGIDIRCEGYVCIEEDEHCIGEPLNRAWACTNLCWLPNGQPVCYGEDACVAWC